jgi:hypothetical protein
MPELVGHRVRWWVPLATLGSGLAIGVSVGAVTNAINLRVSQNYFERVMNWRRDVPLRTILQGMLEGGVLGLFFGLTLSIASAASSRLRAPFRLVLRVLLNAVTIVLICWIAGGTIGACLATFDPQLFWLIIPVGPPSWGLTRFAWVGGTIWGAYAGTAIATLTGCIMLHRRWRSAAAPALVTTAFPVIPIVAESGATLEGETTSSPDRDLVV